MSVRNKFRKYLGILKNKNIHSHIGGFLRWSVETALMEPILSRSPIHLHLEPTTRCNLSCSMCEHTYWKEKKVDITFEKFCKILDKMPGLASVDLTGIGEGLLNKDFLKILEEGKRRNLRMRFNTNGTLFNPEIAKKIVDLEVDEIHFSVDGGTKETFESIRKGAKFEKVLESVDFIQQAKKNLHQKPELHFICIAMKETVHEIPKLVDIAASKHVKYVDIQGMIEFEQNQEHGSHSLKISDVAESFAEAKKKADKLRVHLVLPGLTEKKTTCLHPWFQTYVLSDGTVLPCCLYGQQNNREELRNELSFGNILEDDFDDIWNNQKYQDIRGMLASDKLSGICAKCPIPKGKF